MRRVLRPVRAPVGRRSVSALSRYTSVEKWDRSVTGEANETLSLEGSGGAMTFCSQPDRGLWPSVVIRSDCLASPALRCSGIRLGWLWRRATLGFTFVDVAVRCRVSVVPYDVVCELDRLGLRRDWMSVCDRASLLQCT